MAARIKVQKAGFMRHYTVTGLTRERWQRIGDDIRALPGARRVFVPTGGSQDETLIVGVEDMAVWNQLHNQILQAINCYL